MKTMKFLCMYYIKCAYFKNYRPPNSDELNIDCVPVSDSPRKPHNLRVLQSHTNKLRKQIKMLTVSLIHSFSSI